MESHQKEEGNSPARVFTESSERGVKFLGVREDLLILSLES